MKNTTKVNEIGNITFEAIKQCYLTGAQTECMPKRTNLRFIRYMLGSHRIIRCLYFSNITSELTLFEERLRYGKYEQVIYDYRDENAYGMDNDSVLLNACKNLWPDAIILKGK